MRTWMRITAVLFLLIGVLLIIGGLVVTLGGGLKDLSTPSPAGVNISLFMFLGRGVAGALIGFQGLLLLALGQALWLMTVMDARLERSNRILSAMARRWMP